MRDYSKFDSYLDSLLGDIYEQPPDEGHSEYAQWLIDNWFSKITSIKNILDVGCGQGFMKPMFERIGFIWQGVNLGLDYSICVKNNLPVDKADFSFLPYLNNSFDCIIARHVLEHSPFPLLTLMEWRRVSKQWLCVVLPNPQTCNFRGKNHYSVMTEEHFIWLSNRAGWKVTWINIIDFEMRFMLIKDEEIKE